LKCPVQTAVATLVFAGTYAYLVTRGVARTPCDVTQPQILMLFNPWH